MPTTSTINCNLINPIDLNPSKEEDYEFSSINCIIQSYQLDNYTLKDFTGGDIINSFFLFLILLLGLTALIFYFFRKKYEF